MEHCSSPSVVFYRVRLKGCCVLKFSELARTLEQAGFRIVREKGSVRYYTKPGCLKLIRLDYHGAKEVPTGTCSAILKAAGIRAKYD